MDVAVWKQILSYLDIFFIFANIVYYIINFKKLLTYPYFVLFEWCFLYKTSLKLRSALLKNFIQTSFIPVGKHRSEIIQICLFYGLNFVHKTSFFLNDVHVKINSGYRYNRKSSRLVLSRAGRLSQLEVSDWCLKTI